MNTQFVRIWWGLPLVAFLLIAHLAGSGPWNPAPSGWNAWDGVQWVPVVWIVVEVCYAIYREVRPE